MPRDARVWLDDIASHGAMVATFLGTHTFEEYSLDDMLRAAVERKLFIVGEAVVQLRNSHPDVAIKLPDVTRVVGFRNVHAHGYFIVDDKRVFDIGSQELPELVEAAHRLLAGD